MEIEKKAFASEMSHSRNWKLPNGVHFYSRKDCSYSKKCTEKLIKNNKNTSITNLLRHDLARVRKGC